MIVGVRLPEDVNKRLMDIAENSGTTKSALIRAAIGRYITQYNYNDMNINWKPKLWKLLDLDIGQINYALQHTDTAEEFFSYMHRWTKRFRINTQVASDNKLHVYLKDEAGNKLHAAWEAVDTKISIIAHLTEQLYENFLNKMV